MALVAHADAGTGVAQTAGDPALCAEGVTNQAATAGQSQPDDADVMGVALQLELETSQARLHMLAEQYAQHVLNDDSVDGFDSQDEDGPACLESSPLSRFGSVHSQLAVASTPIGSVCDMANELVHAEDAIVVVPRVASCSSWHVEQQEHVGWILPVADVRRESLDLSFPTDPQEIMQDESGSASHAGADRLDLAVVASDGAVLESDVALAVAVPSVSLLQGRIHEVTLPVERHKMFAPEDCASGLVAEHQDVVEGFVLEAPPLACMEIPSAPPMPAEVVFLDMPLQVSSRAWPLEHDSGMADLTPASAVLEDKQLLWAADSVATDFIVNGAGSVDAVSNSAQSPMMEAQLVTAAMTPQSTRMPPAPHPTPMSCCLESPIAAPVDTVPEGGWDLDKGVAVSSLSFASMFTVDAPTHDPTFMTERTFSSLSARSAADIGRSLVQATHGAAPVSAMPYPTPSADDAAIGFLRIGSETSVLATGAILSLQVPSSSLPAAVTPLTSSAPEGMEELASPGSQDLFAGLEVVQMDAPAFESVVTSVAEQAALRSPDLAASSGAVTPPLPGSPHVPSAPYPSPVVAEGLGPWEVGTNAMTAARACFLDEAEKAGVHLLEAEMEAGAPRRPLDVVPLATTMWAVQTHAADVGLVGSEAGPVMPSSSPKAIGRLLGEQLAVGTPERNALPAAPHPTPVAVDAREPVVVDTPVVANKIELPATPVHTFMIVSQSQLEAVTPLALGDSMLSVAESPTVEVLQGVHSDTSAAAPCSTSPVTAVACMERQIEGALLPCRKPAVGKALLPGFDVVLSTAMAANTEFGTDVDVPDVIGELDSTLMLASSDPPSLGQGGAMTPLVERTQSWQTISLNDPSPAGSAKKGEEAMSTPAMALHGSDAGGHVVQPSPTTYFTPLHTFGSPHLHRPRPPLSPPTGQTVPRRSTSLPATPYVTPSGARACRVSDPQSSSARKAGGAKVSLAVAGASADLRRTEPVYMLDVQFSPLHCMRELMHPSQWPTNHAEAKPATVLLAAASAVVGTQVIAADVSGLEIGQECSALLGSPSSNLHPQVGNKAPGAEELAASDGTHPAESALQMLAMPPELLGQQQEAAVWGDAQAHSNEQRVDEAALSQGPSTLSAAEQEVAACMVQIPSQHTSPIYSHTSPQIPVVSPQPRQRTSPVCFLTPQPATPPMQEVLEPPHTLPAPRSIPLYSPASMPWQNKVMSTFRSLRFTPPGGQRMFLGTPMPTQAPPADTAGPLTANLHALQQRRRAVLGSPMRPESNPMAASLSVHDPGATPLSSIHEPSAASSLSLQALSGAMGASEDGAVSESGSNDAGQTGAGYPAAPISFAVPKGAAPTSSHSQSIGLGSSADFAQLKVSSDARRGKGGRSRRARRQLVLLNESATARSPSFDFVPYAASADADKTMHRCTSASGSEKPQSLLPAVGSGMSASAAGYGSSTCSSGSLLRNKKPADDSSPFSFGAPAVATTKLVQQDQQAAIVAPPIVFTAAPAAGRVAVQASEAHAVVAAEVAVGGRLHNKASSSNSMAHDLASECSDVTSALAALDDLNQDDGVYGPPQSHPLAHIDPPTNPPTPIRVEWVEPGHDVGVCIGTPARAHFGTPEPQFHSMAPILPFPMQQAVRTAVVAAARVSPSPAATPTSSTVTNTSLVDRVKTLLQSPSVPLLSSPSPTPGEGSVQSLNRSLASIDPPPPQPAVLPRSVATSASNTSASAFPLLLGECGTRHAAKRQAKQDRKAAMPPPNSTLSSFSIDGTPMRDQHDGTQQLVAGGVVAAATGSAAVAPIALTTPEPSPLPFTPPDFVDMVSAEPQQRRPMPDMEPLAGLLPVPRTLLPSFSSSDNTTGHSLTPVPLTRMSASYVQSPLSEAETGNAQAAATNAWLGRKRSAQEAVPPISPRGMDIAALSDTSSEEAFYPEPCEDERLGGILLISTLRNLNKDKENLFAPVPDTKSPVRESLQLLVGPLRAGIKIHKQKVEELRRSSVGESPGPLPVKAKLLRPLYSGPVDTEGLDMTYSDWSDSFPWDGPGEDMDVNQVTQFSNDKEVMQSSLSTLGDLTTSEAHALLHRSSDDSGAKWPGTSILGLHSNKKSRTAAKPPVTQDPAARN